MLPIAATSRTIVPALRARGYTVDYTEFSGGHEVPASITTASAGLVSPALEHATTPHRSSPSARAQRAQDEQQEHGADEGHEDGAGQASEGERDA